MSATDAILTLEDVHAAYLQKEILRGLSLTVHAGEIVALLGENGSGKSTTLKVIAGLLNPSQGTVRYQGRSLNGLGVPQRQQLGIGYLMQGGRVFPNLTMEENFNLAASNVRSTNATPALGDWFTDLRDRRSDRAGLLSGGQRQMLAIELVLVQKPQLLLLDEPTSSLSAELGAKILSSIRRSIKATGASALLVEQNGASAASASDRTLHLSSGLLETQQRRI
jgi:ABC-type branched-subunit amino acid transport system ATPase component